MRAARLKAPADRPVGFYHCLSRVVDRRFVFDDMEKERFVALMRECERFSRVRVLTYCVMANHFHLLVEVWSLAILRGGGGASARSIRPDPTSGWTQCHGRGSVGAA